MSNGRDFVTSDPIYSRREDLKAVPGRDDDSVGDGRDHPESGLKMNERREQLTDRQCHVLARRFVKRLVGTTPADLCWDQDHHLQGHMHVGEHELVVIAPRDLQHEAIVLTAEDWDEIRHAPGAEAAALVRQRAIHDHDHLLAKVS